MARPESINDIADSDRYVRVAMFETERIMTDATLLKHYTALLETITKMGGYADKSYSTIDLNVPKNPKQLEDQLKSDQYRWDDMQDSYNKVITCADPTEPVPDWKRKSIQQWAKDNDMPDPFDVFAANNADIMKLRLEMGMDA